MIGEWLSSRQLLITSSHKPRGVSILDVHNAVNKTSVADQIIQSIITNSQPGLDGVPDGDGAVIVPNAMFPSDLSNMS